MLTITVFVYSESIQESDAFHRLLNNLATDYQLYDRTTLCRQDNSIDNGGVNLFVVDYDTQPRSVLMEEVRARLDTVKRSVNLCLLPEAPTTLVPELCTLFHDFILWPCGHLEVKARIEKFRHHHREPLKATNEKQLIDQFAAMSLTGQSPTFVQLLTLIRKVSQCHATVLIEGETGTGKENAARAIHNLGPRRKRGFVPVNCAAIPDELFESELFGHARGAFTDAKMAQEGLVEIANGGTLFLDEIDSLSSKAQAALLRFLQNQEYRPLGAKRARQANVRILAATNANLLDMTKRKAFREDLYFRLNVLQVFMPPLRDRRSDIPLIAISLLEKFSHQYQAVPKILSQEYLELLKKRDWHGNVRELENVLLRSFLLTDGVVIKPGEKDADRVFERLEESNPSAPVTLSFQEAKSRAIQDFERTYLEQVIRLAQGNVSAAARIAGKERRSLGKLLQKYDINKFEHASYSESMS